MNASWTYRIGAAVLVWACASVTPGCAAGRGDGSVLHVVLIKLKDPALVPDMERDAREALPAVRGVKRLRCGRALGLLRPMVDSAYDSAITMEFDSADAYDRYLNDPAHVAVVTKWKPEMESIRVIDITPAPR